MDITGYKYLDFTGKLTLTFKNSPTKHQLYNYQKVALVLQPIKFKNEIFSNKHLFLIKFMKDLNFSLPRIVEPLEFMVDDCSIQVLWCCLCMSVKGSKQE